MMRRRHNRRSVSLLLVGLLVLAACGDASETDGTDLDDAPDPIEEEEEEEEEATDSPDGAGDLQGTLTFSTIGGTVPAQTQVLQDAIAAFEHENSGVSIELQEVGWGEAFSQFQASVATGSSPDIAMLTQQWTLDFAGMDAFASIEDYVSDDVFDRFLDSGFDGLTDADGNRFGLPWDGSIWGLFYRTDLFEEVGLDPNSPPETWDELLEYAQALTTDDRYGLAMPAAGWEPDDYFLPFLWQAGNDVVEEVEPGIYEATFDADSALAAATFYQSLIQEHAVMSQDIVGMDWEDVKNAFGAGNVAMMFNGMWATGALQGTHPEIEGEWATALSPEGPGGRGQLGYSNVLVVTQQSEHKEVAGAFLQFLHEGHESNEPTWYDRYITATGVVGWTHDFAEIDDEFVRDPLIQQFIEAIPYARNRPLVSGYEEFRQLVFNAGIQELALGDISPEDFVESMDEGFQSILDQ